MPEPVFPGCPVEEADLMTATPEQIRARDPVRLMTRVARLLERPEPPTDVWSRYVDERSDLGAPTQHVLWSALPEGQITPRLAEVVADYSGQPGDVTSTTAAALLERPALSRATVERLLSPVVALFATSVPSGRDVRVLAHLARARHLSAADRAALLQYWDHVAPGERPTAGGVFVQHNARRWWLREALVHDPALDTATLLQFAEDASPTANAAAGLARVIGHPHATVAVWAAATRFLASWPPWQTSEVTRALASAPALARRSSWRTQLQRQGLGGSTFEPDRRIFRTLVARPDLDWAPEVAGAAVRAHLSGPAPDAEVAATLAAAAPRFRAAVPADTWAWALQMLPRERRLLILRILGTPPGAEAPVLTPPPPPPRRR